MKREHGACFIWTCNPWEKDNSFICREYKKGMVFTFAGSFITSRYDSHLEKLLKDRLRSKYTGTKDDSLRIDEIYKYAEKLNMSILIWS